MLKALCSALLLATLGVATLAAGLVVAGQPPAPPANTSFLPGLLVQLHWLLDGLALAAVAAGGSVLVGGGLRLAWATRRL